MPLLVVIHTLSNPAHARYSIPVIALSSGPVVLGLHRLLGRRTGLVVALVIASAAVWTVPQLARYRAQVSPPVAAVDDAIAQAGSRRGVVVADRTLHAFFVLRRLTVPTSVPVIFDHMIELGHVPPPPPELTIYVFDRGHGGLAEKAVSTRTFSCTIPLVRALAQGRFTDVTVETGATLRDESGASGPLVLVD